MLFANILVGRRSSMLESKRQWVLCWRCLCRTYVLLLLIGIRWASPPLADRQLVRTNYETCGMRCRYRTCHDKFFTFSVQNKLAIGEHRGIRISSDAVVRLVVRWYTVTTYDLCMTHKNYVHEEWNATKSGHQYHVVVHTPYSKKKQYILTQYFRHFTVVWKRQE